MRGVVVDDSDILGTTEQAIEVVGIDGRFVVSRCQIKRLTQRVGDERVVGYASGHVALVGREQQYVVKVKVTRLEYPHNLQSDSRFAMKRNSSLLNEIGRERQQC